MTKKRKIGYLLLLLLLIMIGGFIMNELKKSFIGEIPSQRQVIQTYQKNSSTFDFIASYITDFEKNEDEIFYIKSGLIEIHDRHGKIDRNIEFSEDFIKQVENLFDNSNITLIYDERNGNNCIIFEADCKNSFLFNGIAITKNNNDPKWDFIKLQKSEHISDHVYYFEGK